MAAGLAVLNTKKELKLILPKSIVFDIGSRWNYYCFYHLTRYFSQRKKLPAPQFIKIDIEGTELNALKGAQETLAHKHPTIFLSTHGKEIHKHCCQFLTSLDYNLESMDKQRPIEESSEILATISSLKS